MYKVFWDDGNVIDADVLAAIESAISDGVDILSLSMSLDAPDFYKNVEALQRQKKACFSRQQRAA